MLYWNNSWCFVRKCHFLEQKSSGITHSKTTLAAKAANFLWKVFFS
jgi:hypothetical protein